MRKMLKLTGLALLALSLGWAMGCKPATTGPAPVVEAGACNSTDAGIYQALYAVQGSLKSLHATLTNPKTDAGTVATLKPYYNQAATDYDIANVAWQTYHAACLANPSTSPASAQAALTKVQTDLQTTPKVTQ